MMMQMLQAGGAPLLTDGQRTADQDNPRGYFELEAVKRSKRDASWLEQAAGKAVKIIHALLYDLPLDRHYRVIFMQRRVEEVLRSQQAMLQRGNRKGAEIAPERLARAFRRQRDDAIRYVREHTCFDVLEVHYDQVISQPRDQAEAIRHFLEWDLDVDRMAARVDPSLYRQKR